MVPNCCPTVRVSAGLKTHSIRQVEGCANSQGIGGLTPPPADAGSLTVHVGLLEALPGSKVEVAGHL